MGKNPGKAYFEGWYFKQVSGDLNMVVSIIPGISLDAADPHCFIQLIANRLSSDYFRFPLEDFHYEEAPFSIRIGDNHFTENGVSICLEGQEISLKGSLNFGPFTKIETSLLQPSIMGIFAYVPKMECNHGILSMSHSLSGTMELKGETVSFDRGKGYIEKDFGTSFPRSYLWIQSNHFSGSDASFMCSIARIPFLGASFQGVICNLVVLGREYRFATYNGTKVMMNEFSPGRTTFALRKKGLVLSVAAETSEGALLKSPWQGAMSHQIREGLSGRVHVKLERVSGEVIFEGTGLQCGVELMPEGGVKQDESIGV